MKRILNKNLTLDTKQLCEALLIRRVEERLLSLFAEGRISGTLHTCSGQEFVPIAVISALTPDDTIFSTHRGHGHFISWTNNIEGLIAEVVGKSTGVCGGIGGTQHLHTTGFYSNGIQGGLVPVSAGMALSFKINETDNIAVAFVGDGSLGQGIFYETINIASKWDLPLLIVVENNEYAQSTPVQTSLAGSVKGRAEAFDIRYTHSNTWDIENLVSMALESASYVRENGKPLIFEINTYRLNAHSKGDDFRDPKEISRYSERDILNTLLSSLNPKIEKLIKTVELRIDTAVSKSLKASSSEVIIFAPKDRSPIHAWKKLEFEKDRISNIIYQSLKNLLARHPKTVLLGEDIEFPYGGAFKVTKDLSTLFPGRVKNTPVSESAIMGIATGLALGGYLPIIEIMFGDFLTLIFDQLFNHACKFRTIYNNQVEIPLVIRTPMGAGRGYGPTHSQSIEKFFIGIPDLQIVALNSRIPPDILYNGIFENLHHPVLVIENKELYSKFLNGNNLSGFDILCSDENFPCLRISPIDETPDVTIFCYGGVLDNVEQVLKSVFFEEEILCEVICPSLIFPVNIEPILDSISVTKKIVTIEEGSNIASLSSEIIARLCELNVEITAMRRLGNNSIIPSSMDNELQVLPNKNKIYEAIVEVHRAK